MAKSEPSVKRGKKKSAISGMKDALKAEERCSDKCYAGCSKLYGFQSIVDHATPEPLKVLPQSHVCLAVFLFNIILLGVYVYFYDYAFKQCVSQQFLSLDKTDKWSFNVLPGYQFEVGQECKNVKLSLSEEFYLDDEGIWSSKNSFDFTGSMIRAEFRGYSETESVYRNDNATDIHRTLLQWQRELSDEPWDRTLVKLTQLYSALDTSRIILSTDVSPARLMDTTYIYPTLWKRGMNESQLFDKKNGYDYRINSTVWYEDYSDYFSLWMSWRGVKGTFPAYDDIDMKRDDDQIKKGDKDFRINKYSLFTAAAVNMGLLNVTELKVVGWNVTGVPSGSLVDDYTTLTDEDDDTTDDDDSSNNDNYFNDDTYNDDDLTDDASRRLSQKSSKEDRSGDGSDGEGDVTESDVHGVPVMVRELLAADERERRGLTTMSDVSAKAAYPYVVRKFASAGDSDQAMDAIHCVEVKKKGVDNNQKCWLRINGDDHDNEFGLTIFPIIQASDGCSSSCSSSTDDDRKECKNPNYRIGLIFDAASPGRYVWFDFDGKQHSIEDYIREYEASAFTLDMVGGMTYLNDAYYNRRVWRKLNKRATGRTSLHCTSMTKPAFEILKKSANKCSTMSASNRKKSGTYCADPPATLVESYNQCEFTEGTCYLNSFSEAFGYLGTVQPVLMILFLLWASTAYSSYFKEDPVEEALGLSSPKEEAPDEDEAGLTSAEKAEIAKLLKEMRKGKEI